MREECETMDLLFPESGCAVSITKNKAAAQATSGKPLQQQVKAQGLWACHLGSEPGRAGLWPGQAGA